MILIKDSNGLHTELSEEEFLIALQHGIGVVIMQLEREKAHPKMINYVKGHKLILSKIRPTHLVVTHDFARGNREEAEGNSGTQEKD